MSLPVASSGAMIILAFRCVQARTLIERVKVWCRLDIACVS